MSKSFPNSFHCGAVTALTTAALISTTFCRAADAAPAPPWNVGTPIVTYWCGPSMTDAVAQQMAEGGWNLVWCGEAELDRVQRHGLRAQLSDGLLTPASLDTPAQREKLDALIARVRAHPALYAYFITDEPNAAEFPALGRLVSYLRERDPAHLAYINLFPTYASNKQLGTQGNVVAAYQEHLRLFGEQVKPALISYDHYQFRLQGDGDQYFLNLGLIRRAAQEAGLPFLNIVQASTWAPDSMRVPGTNELRYLVFTTLAYGAQGISYYIYTCANHLGGIALADGTPTPLYHGLKRFNREFVALARELQPLRSLGVYHTVMKEAGCMALPADAPFRLEGGQPSDSGRGFLLGSFGSGLQPTHVVVVNLDYRAEGAVTLVGSATLASFDATTATWAAAKQTKASLRLPPGGGQLLRVER